MFDLKSKKFWYIGLFAILYLIVAFSSFFHACAFFGLANNSWMSIILAFAFEVGQAAVLFSLLTSNKDRSRIMPWVLMTMFTLVQVIGNVYSSYKYIIQNSVENLKYFKEPIFIWTDLPDAQANVIIVYLVGALLPIAALLLTSMITNYLSDQSDEKLLENKFLNTEGDSLLNQNSMLHMENQGLQEQVDKLKEDLEKKTDSLSAFSEAVENRDNHIENLEKEIENLKNASDITEEVKKENEELKEKNDKLVSQEEELVQSIAKLESDNDNLRKSDEAYKKAYNEVNNENSNLKEEIVKLQDKLLELENNQKIQKDLQQEKTDEIDESNKDTITEEIQSDNNEKVEESNKPTNEQNKEEVKEIDKNIQLADVLMGGNILKEKNKKPSHFINK